MIELHEVLGYAYEADIHCLDCTLKRFPKLRGVDREGNRISPVMVEGAIAQEVEVIACTDCQEILWEEVACE